MEDSANSSPASARGVYVSSPEEAKTFLAQEIEDLGQLREAGQDLETQQANCLRGVGLTD